MNLQLDLIRVRSTIYHTIPRGTFLFNLMQMAIIQCRTAFHTILIRTDLKSLHSVLSNYNICLIMNLQLDYLYFIKFKCCGVDSYEDFTKATAWNTSLAANVKLVTPIACCKELPKSNTDFLCATTNAAFPSFEYLNNGNKVHSQLKLRLSKLTSIP